MLVLASTDRIQVITSAAVALDALVAFADNTSSAFTPGSQATAITTATTTTIASSPAASTQRNVSNISLSARGGANTVTVQFFNGTAFQEVSVALASGERLEYENGCGWSVYDAAGQYKTVLSGTPGHTVRVNSAGLTQRAAIDFLDTTAIAMVGTDNGGLGETQIQANFAAQAGNTVLANDAAGSAAPHAVSLAVQSALIRSAANIVAIAAAAGQVLGRTAAAGNLGFIPVPGGLLRAPQVVLATNATFAHPTGTALIVAIGIAAGGGGTGAVNSAAAQITLGGGGASGGHFFHVFTAISGTSNVTIGAAGAAGANTGAAAGNGGNTSIVHNGVTVTALGGPGAPINTTAGMAGVSGLTFAASPGAIPPGVSTGANLNGGGSEGGLGIRYSGAAAQSGNGGGGMFGGAGLGRLTHGNGNNAIGPGGGGSGALSAAAAGAVTGGAGFTGAVVFFEFG